MVTVVTIHDLLLIAFGIGVWRAGADAHNRSLRWSGVTLIAAHAFGLLIHSFFPMTSRWLESTSSDWMHGASSAVWGIGISAAIVLAAVAIRGWFRWFSIASLVVILGFTALSSVAIQGIEENDTPWAGALERVSAYGFMVWLVVLAWVTLRPYRAETEPSLGSAQSGPARAGLAGTIGARVGDEEFEATRGCYLIKPRGVPHAFWNPTDELARTVEAVVPGGFEAFFEELAEASSTGDARLIQQRRADLALKYRLAYLTELVPDLKGKYGLMLIGE